MGATQPMPVEQQPAEGDLGPGLLEAVWRYRWLVIAATLVAALTGFAASYLQPTMYEGEARLLLADPRGAGAFGDGSQLVVGDGTRYVRNQAEYVGSTPVMVRASELIDGAATPTQLANRKTVQPSADLDLITVRVLAPTAQGAADATNAVGRAYMDVRSEEIQARAEARIAELQESKEAVQQRLASAESTLRADPENPTARAERDAMASQLVSLEGRIEQISVNASLYGSGVELFEQATPPSSPAQPRPARNAAVAGVLGLLAAAAFSWWRAEQTMSADHRQDPAPILRAPLLGEVPEFSESGVVDVTPSLSSPHSPAGEAYQFIVAALEVAQRESGARTVLLTSPQPADGKTVTCVNLAVAAKRDGREVLLVDGDERARGLTRLSEVEAEPGLTDLADPDVPFRGCIAHWRLADDLALPFIPAGEKVRDPAGFFRSAPFRKGVRQLADAADLVLVDSPPVLAVADTVALASQFDGIVLVVTRGTSLRLLEEVRMRLDFLGVPVLGYVFNRGTRSRRRYGYGGYGYGYGYGQDRGGNGARNGGDAPADRQGLRGLVRRRG